MATQSSDLVANGRATPVVRNPPDKAGGVLSPYNWALTGVNGVDGEVYELAKVARNERVMAAYSRLVIPAQGAARVASMGWAAHQDAEGNEVAADASGFFSGLDVSAAVEGIVDRLTVTGLVADRLMAGDAIITLTITGDTAVAGAFSGSLVVART